MPGHGDGTFAAHTDYPAAGGPAAIAIADLDEDSRPDVVYVNQYNYPEVVSAVSVMLGHGDGTLAPRLETPCGFSPRGLRVVDLDGDGHLDAATSNSGNSVSILLGRGDGTFRSRADYGTGNTALSLDVGDVDHDGYPDVVAVNYLRPRCPCSDRGRRASWAWRPHPRPAR